jgi:hypothetical protein
MVLLCCVICFTLCQTVACALCSNIYLAHFLVQVLWNDIGFSRVAILLHMAQWRHGDGGWKSRGGRWAGGEVQHADSSSNRFILWNLVLEEHTLTQDWRRSGQATVVSALGLDPPSWP